MSRERIHYLDWLKVLIVYGILVFHASLVFSVGTWLVSNHQRSIALSAFAGFCFTWGIPAMFLISGADAWFGLRSRTASEFVIARVERLLIPLAVGIVVLTPIQRYVTSHNPPPPLGQLWGFYVAFFGSIRNGFSPQWIADHWLHLWFLGYLFAISVACLPALRWLQTIGGRRLTSRLVVMADRRLGVYLLGLPLFLSQMALRPVFPTYQSWADVATYTCAFVYGAVLFGDRAFELSIRRNIRWLLATGTVAALGLAAILFLVPALVHMSGAAAKGMELAYSFLWGLDVWSWLLAVLYLGIRWLDSPSRVLSYANESVLPFYVLHHPVVLIVASFIVSTSLGVWPKFAIVVAAAFALTMGVYEFGVRRWSVTRFLFGLKPLSEAGAGAIPPRTQVA